MKAHSLSRLKQRLKGYTPDMTTLKKSKMLSNWPKWLVVTQSVLFGSKDLEIRSHVSSFSASHQNFQCPEIS